MRGLLRKAKEQAPRAAAPVLGVSPRHPQISSFLQEAPLERPPSVTRYFIDSMRRSGTYHVAGALLFFLAS